MIEQGNRIYSDDMMRKELCFMCLTHKDLYRAEYNKHNRMHIMVCKDCIAMNGHKLVTGKNRYFKPI